jgi:phytoene desaturase
VRTVPGRTDRVVVVGAGLAGLSAALHLRGAGREVTVVERGAGPGGRTGRVERHGYALDTGPSVFTAPDVVADALAAVGEKLEERLTLLPLETTYRAQFADGSHLDVRADPDAFAAEVARTCGGAEADALRRYLADLADLYRLQLGTFIDRNLDSPLDLLRPELVALARRGGFRRLSRHVERAFADDRLRRLFSFQALYAGVSPYRAIAAYAVIAHLDIGAGVWHPVGGIAAVPRALAAAAADAGVTFRYGTAVDALEVG